MTHVMHIFLVFRLTVLFMIAAPVFASCYRVHTHDKGSDWAPDTGDRNPDQGSESESDTDVVLRECDPTLEACGCSEDFSAIDSNLQWQIIHIPPMIFDGALDSHGNGWFVFQLGLIYWDFGSAAADAPDGTGRPFVFSKSDINGIAVDAADLKWAATADALYRIDDRQTIEDVSDDIWESIVAPASNIQRIRVDSHNRVWVNDKSGSNVWVLPDPTLESVSESDWIEVFTTGMRDIAAEGGGIWLAANSGLYYVDTGSTLYDTSDDVWLEVVGPQEMNTEYVRSIHVDDAGIKWFSTASGIFRLDDKQDPLNTSEHKWTKWAPEQNGVPVRLGHQMLRAPRGDDTLWMMTQRGTVLRYDERAPDKTTYAEYDLKSYSEFSSSSLQLGVQSIGLGAKNEKWIVSEKRLYYFDDQSCPMVTAASLWLYIQPPLYEHKVSLNDLMLDPLGGAWIMISNYSPKEYNNICSRHGIQYGNVADPQDPFDDLWSAHALPGCNTVPLAVDPYGFKWFISFGFSSIDGAHALQGIPTSTGDLDIPWVTAIPTGEFVPIPSGLKTDGRLWFYNGVVKDYGGTPGDDSDDKSIALWDCAESPEVIAKDSRGGNWVSTDYDNILVYYSDNNTPEDFDDDVCVNFTAEDGMPFENIKDIQIDDFDIKWFVRSGGEIEPQLASLDDNGTPEDKTDDKWTSYSQNDGLSGTSISNIVIDKNSVLWVGTENGISYRHLVR